MTDVNPQVPFDGDYQKTLQAYQQLQAQVTPLNQKNAELTTQMEQMQTQINQLSSKPNSSTTPESGSGGGGSLYDWNNAAMRTESGQVDPNLIAAMGKAGAAPEVVESIVKSVEDAREMAELFKANAIQRTVGTEENLNSLIEWGKTNANNPQVKAANYLISDVRTLGDGLEILKQQAEANGFTPGSATPEVRTTNEPSPIPQTTTGVGGVVPLNPNSREGQREIFETMQSKDPEKIKQMENRIAANRPG